MITRRSYRIDAKSLQSLRTITKWLITFRAFIQATSNKRDTLLEKWKKNSSILRQNSRLIETSQASLPQSSSCHVVGQPFDTVVQAALVQTNRISLWRRTKESVSASDSSDWNRVLNFSRSPLSAFIPRSDETVQTSYWQQWPAKQGSLWRRTKESVGVPDSSDLNCAELFSFCNFCFHPAH